MASPEAKDAVASRPADAWFRWGGQDLTGELQGLSQFQFDGDQFVPMSPQTNGASLSLGSRQQLQFQGFCARRPLRVNSSCQRAETD